MRHRRCKIMAGICCSSIILLMYNEVLILTINLWKIVIKLIGDDYFKKSL